MTERYTCGHIAERDEETDEYSNGSYALWEEYSIAVSPCEYNREWELATCYGVLCNDCIILYNARKCKLGGVE